MIAAFFVLTIYDLVKVLDNSRGIRVNKAVC